MSVALIPHQDVRCNANIDHPAKELAGTIGCISSEPIGGRRRCSRAADDLADYPAPYLCDRGHTYGASKRPHFLNGLSWSFDLGLTVVFHQPSGAIFPTTL